jgi:hypothetical protein
MKGDMKRIVLCGVCGNEMADQHERPEGGPWVCVECLKEQFPYAWRELVRPPWAVYRQPSLEDEIPRVEFTGHVVDRLHQVDRLFPGPEPRGGRMAACGALRALEEQQIALFPDFPWKVGTAEFAEREWAAHDEAAARDACGDCGARIGELHTPGCDLEVCGRCDKQWISCECPIDQTMRRVPWRGWRELKQTLWRR